MAEWCEVLCYGVEGGGFESPMGQPVTVKSSLCQHRSKSVLHVLKEG